MLTTFHRTYPNAQEYSPNSQILGNMLLDETFGSAFHLPWCQDTSGDRFGAAVCCYQTGYDGNLYHGDDYGQSPDGFLRLISIKRKDASDASDLPPHYTLKHS